MAAVFALRLAAGMLACLLLLPRPRFILASTVRISLPLSASPV